MFEPMLKMRSRCELCEKVVSHHYEYFRIGLASFVLQFSHRLYAD